MTRIYRRWTKKSNEITEIPELLDKIQIKNQVVTIEALGTQKEIAEKNLNVLMKCLR